MKVDRRTVLAATGGTLATAALPRAALSLAPEPPPSPLVRRVVQTPQNTYFTYPHANGFLPDGRCVIASPVGGDDNGHIDYIGFDLDRGQGTLLTHADDARLYWSISARGLMGFSTKTGASVVDLTQPGAKPRHLFQDPDYVIAADCDIAPDGTRLLVTRNHYKTPEDYQTGFVDVATGAYQSILDPGWPMDHVHFSPFDPSFVAFADNRPKVPDRLWVWNAKTAPAGRHLFPQTRPDGTIYDIGHERAMFNKPALLVIAYGGESTARPCGLFEVSFSGATRLVSASLQYFHCNVSRDGRWAVVSTQGPWDPGLARPYPHWLTSGGPDFGISDVLVVNMKSGATAFLYRATNASRGQPYEVQPTISPDGRYVLCKDAQSRSVHAVELDPKALARHLAS